MVDSSHESCIQPIPAGLSAGSVNFARIEPSAEKRSDHVVSKQLALRRAERERERERERD
jgi:hypothetical protein